jgi:hypothetical protein
MPDDDLWYEMDNVDYEGMKISDLLKKEKEKIIYEYDFGDGWEHDIILEKILPFDNKKVYPICIKGKMSCPPEDCGGAWGYANMLKILKQPDHEEYESYIQWLGGVIDPHDFDAEGINNVLTERGFEFLEL